MKLNLRVILMLLAFSSVAKAEEVRFSHFGAEQGMAQIGLWGVTQDGGNLPSALVKNTAVDSKGRLWLSMDQRVCCYDADIERFIPSKLLPVPGQIFYIEEKCPGVMLLATSVEIFEYDEKSEECKSFFRLSYMRPFSVELGLSLKFR